MGTLIAIDMALTLAPTEGTVDIPKILATLRRQRMKMVQTAVSLLLHACLSSDGHLACVQDQYIFIHDAVLESLSCGDTQIPAGDLVRAIQRLSEKDAHTGKTGYETQFQVDQAW